MRRLVAVTAVVWSAIASAANAAGVGISLPKFRALSVTPNGGSAAVSYGGSVQVLGGDVSISLLRLGASVDYAYTRDFVTATNYAFFDPVLSLGLPLAIAPRAYVIPGVDGHALLTVASPVGLSAPALGWGPHLTLGYRPAASLAVELTWSYATFPQAPSQSGPANAGLTTVSLGGSYQF